MRGDDKRAKPSLWLTDQALKRALIEASVFMICPLPVNAAAATLAVYTFRYFEVSFVYLPAPPRLRSGVESLDGNQRSTGFPSSGLKVWRNRVVPHVLIFE
jgi:hypothetical protein